MATAAEQMVVHPPQSTDCTTVSLQAPYMLDIIDVLDRIESMMTGGCSGEAAGKLVPIRVAIGAWMERLVIRTAQAVSKGAPPAAVAASGAARLCGISESQFWKLHSAGKVPLPVYLGAKAPRWRVDELKLWLAASCPDRATWQRTKEVR